MPCVAVSTRRGAGETASTHRDQLANAAATDGMWADMHVAVVVVVFGLLDSAVNDLDAVWQRRQRRQLRDAELVGSVVVLTVVAEKDPNVGLRGALESASAKRRWHVGFSGQAEERATRTSMSRGPRRKTIRMMSRARESMTVTVTSVAM